MLGKDQRPLTTAELIALDDREFLERDTRPWGHVNDSAFSFFSSDRIAVEDADVEGGYVLRSSAPIFAGLPLLDEEHAKGVTIARTREERVAARQLRHRATDSGRSLEGFRPVGVPPAYLPRLSPIVGHDVDGVSARGGRVRLSTTVVFTEEGGVHSTIFDGESRDFLRPTFYPYTAVCKLEAWNLDASGTWVNGGRYGSGFLVGRRTLMTSGHAFASDALASGRFAIKVIPACWANASVFGSGMTTWVRRRRWWHSDSGNDLQVCQLADPVGDSLGYFGARVYDSAWEGSSYWTMAGFPYDRSKFAMSVQHGIHVRDDDDGDDIELDGQTFDTTQIENDADEASGASGSPLFAWWGENNACAIGVHSGYELDWTASGSERWSCAAGGDGFVEIMRWARQNWD